MSISSIEELITFTVQQEEEASEFYRQAMLRTPDKRKPAAAGRIGG